MKFLVGQTYTCRSVCDWDCVWLFKVTKRTAQFVTLVEDSGSQHRVKVRDYRRCEVCSPLGTYSMSPTLTAASGVTL